MFTFMLWVVLLFFFFKVFSLYEFPFPFHFLQLNSFVISIDGRCAWYLVWPAGRFVSKIQPSENRFNSSIFEYLNDIHFTNPGLYVLLQRSTACYFSVSDQIMHML